MKIRSTSQGLGNVDMSLNVFSAKIPVSYAVNLKMIPNAELYK